MTGTAVRWLVLVARLLVGGAWLRAGLGELTDPLGSVVAVQAYDLLPLSVAETVGYALPAVEVVIGLALVVGAMSRGAATISCVLLVGLLVGTVSVWARGIEVEASAGHPLEVVRDLGLLAASVLVAWAGPGRFALDSLLLRRTTTGPVTSDPRTERDLEGVD